MVMYFSKSCLMGLPFSSLDKGVLVAAKALTTSFRNCSCLPPRATNLSSFPSTRCRLGADSSFTVSAGIAPCTYKKRHVQPQSTKRCANLHNDRKLLSGNCSRHLLFLQLLSLLDFLHVLGVHMLFHALFVLRLVTQAMSDNCLFVCHQPHCTKLAKHLPGKHFASGVLSCDV